MQDFFAGGGGISSLPMVARVLISRISVEVFDDWFKLFQVPHVRKGWGSGGTPRNTSSYCFLFASFIFVFKLYFLEVLKD
jgi:hypothetical protein